MPPTLLPFLLAQAHFAVNETNGFRMFPIPDMRSAGR
jgi:hypothetical protein